MHQTTFNPFVQTITWANVHCFVVVCLLWLNHQFSSPHIPQITFPTRFVKHLCSHIDQIFCKTPHKNTWPYSVTYLITYHVLVIWVFQRKLQNDKIRPNQNNTWHSDKRLLRSTFLNRYFIANKCQSLDWSEYLLWKFRQNHHRNLWWIFFREMCEILIHINTSFPTGSHWEYSNRLNSETKNYKRLKTHSPENGKYKRLKHNMRKYNGYLNQRIKAAKKRVLPLNMGYQ